MADAPPPRAAENGQARGKVRTRTNGRTAEITPGDHRRTTVAILGDCPVVGEAIAYLLRSGGYEARLVDAARGEPARADLVLVAAGHPGPERFAGDAPVLWLVDTPEEAERLGGRGILWPCGAGELRARVSELVRAGAAPV